MTTLPIDYVIVQDADLSDALFRSYMRLLARAWDGTQVRDLKLNLAELCQLLGGVSDSTFFNHLRGLKRAGLIASTTDGVENYTLTFLKITQPVANSKVLELVEPTNSKTLELNVLPNSKVLEPETSNSKVLEPNPLPSSKTLELEPANSKTLELTSLTAEHTENTEKTGVSSEKPLVTAAQLQNFRANSKTLESERESLINLKTLSLNSSPGEKAEPTDADKNLAWPKRPPVENIAALQAWIAESVKAAGENRSQQIQLVLLCGGIWPNLRPKLARQILAHEKETGSSYLAHLIGHVAYSRSKECGFNKPGAYIHNIVADLEFCPPDFIPPTTLDSLAQKLLWALTFHRLPEVTEGKTAAGMESEAEASDTTDTPDESAVPAEATPEEKLWANTLRRISYELPRDVFNKWFTNTRLLAITNNSATIGVNAHHIADWLSNRKADSIKCHLEAITQQPIRTVQFEVRLS